MRSHLGSLVPPKNALLENIWCCGTNMELRGCGVVWAVGGALRVVDSQGAGSYVRSLLLALLPGEQQVFWEGILIPGIGDADCALKIVEVQMARSYLVSLLSVCPLGKQLALWAAIWSQEDGTHFRSLGYANGSWRAER